MKLAQFRNLIREEVRRVMNETVLDKKSLEQMLASLKIPKEHIWSYYKDPVSQGFSYKFEIPSMRTDSKLSVDVISPAFIKKLQKALEASEFNVIPGTFKTKTLRGRPSINGLVDVLTVRFMTTKN